MEIQSVEKVITAFKEAGLTSLSLKCQEFELTLGKEIKVQAVSSDNLLQLNEQVVAPEKIEAASTQEENRKSEKCIKAPMVGTFYAASGPKMAPMVQVGSYVKKGDVVCIIEAMKLMNEVEAEVEGEVVEILVQDEEMVEYGQPLFVLR